MYVPSMSMVRMNYEKIIFMVVATCLVLVHGVEVRGRAITDFEVRTWQVKHLDKPTVTSIKVVNLGFNCSFSSNCICYL